MTFEGKSPVQLCQELIAIYSARIEAAQRLLRVYPDVAEADQISEIERSSKTILGKLQEELSMFGDAVQSEVNRSNEYLNTITQIAELSTPGNDRDAIVNFFIAEDQLQNIRQTILTEAELPESFERIIQP